MFAGSLRVARPTGERLFIAGAVLLGLAFGKVLPARLESLSHARMTLVPVVLLFILFAGWLAIERPLTTFVFAFSLVGLVRVEPAPVDIVFGLLIVASFATKPVRPRLPAFVGLPLAGFVILTIISMTNVVAMPRAIKFEATTLYMIALAVWLSWAFAEQVWMHLAMKVYIVVAVVSGLAGPVALYLPLPSRHLLLFGNTRAEGLFKDPNVYSAFLVPAAVILLEELSSPRLLTWRRSRIAVAFGLVSIGVVVAFSRAAWLDLALAVVTLIIVQATRRRGFRRAFKSMLVLVVSGCVGFALLLQTGSLGFLQQRSHLEAYDSQRFATQSSAFSDMTRHAFGYGPGQTEVRLPISTHSSFARAAFEQGLLGISMLVLVLGGTMLCAFLLVQRRGDVNGVGTAALLAIWIGQVANSFFIDTIHWRHIWIFAGLIWCGYAMPHEKERGAPPPLR